MNIYLLLLVIKYKYSKLNTNKQIGIQGACSTVAWFDQVTLYASAALLHFRCPAVG